MLENIKLIGSVVGLLTGIFVLVDRLVRGRPIAWIGKSQFRGGLSLFVKNVSPVDILVTKIHATAPFVVAKDDTVDGVAGAMSNDVFTEVLTSETVREFPLLGNVEAASVRRIRIAISWRRSDSTWWQARKHVRQTVAALTAIRDS